MEYGVSREGTTLVTVHAGSTTTALDDATAELTARLEARTDSDDDRADSDRDRAGPESLARWSVGDPAVYENPTAPFEPYTIEVPFEVTVRVDAPDEAAAERKGETVIDRALETAEVDGLTYSSGPVVSPS